MAYDKDFFKQYLDYLQEPIVKRNHETALKTFRAMMNGTVGQVVDLGCGLGEYSVRGGYTRYLGVDVEQRPEFLRPGGLQYEFLKGDYRDPKTLQDLPFKPDAFVSLFSIEPMLSCAERYNLYRRLFNDHPTVRGVLTAGFYYESRYRQETVEEAGGIVSYQTYEAMPDSRMVEPWVEHRLTMPTPSKMFGPDVVEVWKTLLRRDDGRAPTS